MLVVGKRKKGRTAQDKGYSSLNTYNRLLRRREDTFFQLGHKSPKLKTTHAQKHPSPKFSPWKRA